MTKKRKGLREVLSIALMLCLLLTHGMTALATSEDGGVISFTPTFTSIMDYTASEWYEGNYSRALLTLFLALDLSNEVSETDFSFAEAMNDKTYIGKGVGDSSDSLGVYLHGENKDYVVFYQPSTGYAAYSTLDKASDTVVLLLLPQLFDSNYTNSASDIRTVAGLVQEALED